MATRNNTRSSSGRNRARSGSSRPRRGRSGNSKAPVIIFCLLGIAIIGVLLWWLLRPQDSFDRQTLDKYVAQQQKADTLADGAAVYLDFSNGMNFGYESQGSKDALKNIVNKLTPLADKISFFELAEDKISPMENMSQTALYNYIMNPGSYTRQRAPIEAALQQIVSKNQPAVLITDFEEYNNGVIQQQAYATKYFSQWLSQGNAITFYMFDFTENGKPKHLYYTVFDSNGGALDNAVAQALSTPVPDGMKRFVLAGKGFFYPLYTEYPGSMQGGTYHNDNKKDIVTGVVEEGGPQDYTCYAQPVAGANGDKIYTSLYTSVGAVNQYYPITVAWKNAILNAKKMSEPGIPKEKRFQHLLSKIYVDFRAQDSYTVSGAEARTFDMDGVLAKFDPKGDAKKNEAALKADNAREVLDVFTATLQPTDKLGMPLDEICVDFLPGFDGNFPKEANPGALLKVNVVISQATPNLDAALQFFSWPGNASLFESVKNTLGDDRINPAGQVLISYYLKNFAEK